MRAGLTPRPAWPGRPEIRARRASRARPRAGAGHEPCQAKKGEREKGRLSPFRFLAGPSPRGVSRRCSGRLRGLRRPAVARAASCPVGRRVSPGVPRVAAGPALLAAVLQLGGRRRRGRAASHLVPRLPCRRPRSRGPSGPRTLSLPGSPLPPALRCPAAGRAALSGPRAVPGQGVGWSPPPGSRISGALHSPDLSGFLCRLEVCVHASVGLVRASVPS